MRATALPTLAIGLGLVASDARAAAEYQCGTGGKANLATKKCDCPAGKVESTDAKAVSRCIAPPPAPSPPKSAKEAYDRIDALLLAKWDDDSGPTPKLNYDGTAAVVVKRLEADEKQRAEYLESLHAIDATFHDAKQLPITNAREASVDDSLRAALARAKVEVLDPETDLKIKDIEVMARKVVDDPNASDKFKATAQELLEKADAIRQNTNKHWIDKRKKYYDLLEPQMIDRYARAHIRAKAAGINHPRIDHARKRLAFYTDVLGDAAMKRHLEACEKDFPSFKYVNQMFKTAP